MSSHDLIVEGLTKRFAGRAVVDDVSFTIGAGEIAILSGGNGAGKSTLLRCLAGLLRFDGVARLDGERLRGTIAARRRIGYLPQGVALAPTATVEEALAFYAQLRCVDPTDHRFPSAFLPRADARTNTLSGGQRQRVALAISLLGEPGLLLLDEPTANLDEEARDVVHTALLRRAHDGTIVLVASPDIGDVADIAARALVLRDGILVTDRAVRVVNANRTGMTEMAR